MAWKESVWSQLCGHLGVDPSQASNISLTPSYTLTTYTSPEAQAGIQARLYTGEHGKLRRDMAAMRKKTYDVKQPFDACLRDAYSLTTNMPGEPLPRHVLHLSLDLREPLDPVLDPDADAHGDGRSARTAFRYQAGDHVAIYPQNAPDLVHAFAHRLGLIPSVTETAGLDVPFTMDAKDKESDRRHPFPMPCTYRTALTYYLDFTAPAPRSHILGILAHHTTKETEQTHLQHIATNRDAYHSYIVEPARTLMDVLVAHPSCHVPVELMFEVCVRMQPRYYSISSSPRVRVLCLRNEDMIG